MRTLSLLAIQLGLLAQTEIPRTWDTAAVSQLEVPLANPRYSPLHISEETYYRIAGQA